MKKFMTMLLVAAIGCSLIGCGKKSDDVFEPEEERSWERVERKAKETLEDDSSAVAVSEEDQAAADARVDREDPAHHYEGCEEDILWGGNFALTGRYWADGLNRNYIMDGFDNPDMTTDMEFSDDGSYFSMRMHNDSMDVTMAGIGDDFYVATADGAYRVTDGDAGEELAEEMAGSGNMMIDFSTLEHTGYDNPRTCDGGGKNCYVYQVKTMDGSTLEIYVNRNWETLEVVIPDPDNAENDMYCTASELTKHSFDPAGYDTVEDVSADDAAGILVSAMLGSVGGDPAGTDTENAELMPGAE